MFLLLTIKEASDRLRVSIPTIRSWTYAGKLPVVKLGRRCIYREKDIDDFIQRNLRPAAGEESAAAPAGQR